MADEEVKQEAESTETPETQTESQTESQTQTEEKPECQENSTEQTEAPAEEPKELTPEEKIAELEKENADLKDQLLRRAADFDNYRKRMIKEKQETFDYANANLLADLLESLDNFDRTVEASATATDVKTIVDGIKMVKGSLVQMLENKYGLASYAVEGDEFDPDIHEAIGRVEEEGIEKETLKQIYLKGYKLKDKVIRNAKVMVSVPKN
ncbi:MAG: nucleotide exchange factor GrpE [Treponema sp.]|uniref:nucleotide exchange factor GrpE n=1 Tax=Treponema sp. TaxID=166 RepID=UPI001DCA1615|nr:nucleotide exchange factor GrpE [Treponema sp.]MBS7310248.1 nucleotide exchange factor GrpE [Treponema sp.]MDY5885956.1 nucleotide exchange factor GrpE [Treponema sp.]